MPESFVSGVAGPACLAKPALTVLHRTLAAVVAAASFT